MPSRLIDEFPGNQNRRTTFQLPSLSNLPLMSRNCHLRTFAAYRAALICLVALTLLVARTSGPALAPASSSLHSLVQSQSPHAKRQCLDQTDGFQSNIPTQMFKMLPPLPSFSPLASADKPPLPLQPRGFHYNRPPPLSKLRSFRCFVSIARTRAFALRGRTPARPPGTHEGERRLRSLIPPVPCSPVRRVIWKQSKLLV